MNDIETATKPPTPPRAVAWETTQPAETTSPPAKHRTVYRGLTLTIEIGFGTLASVTGWYLGTFVYATVPTPASAPDAPVGAYKVAAVDLADRLADAGWTGPA